ncbi:MAG: hypothetical protein LBD47_00750 [Treponema sp.]|nr:hypothetical protein [Treponema sp.]
MAVKEKKANARKEAAEAKKKMAARLKTAEGKTIYKKRKETGTGVWNNEPPRSRSPRYPKELLTNNLTI